MIKSSYVISFLFLLSAAEATKGVRCKLVTVSLNLKTILTATIKRNFIQCVHCIRKNRDLFYLQGVSVLGKNMADSNEKSLWTRIAFKFFGKNTHEKRRADKTETTYVGKKRRTYSRSLARDTHNSIACYYPSTTVYHPAPKTISMYFIVAVVLK